MKSSMTKKLILFTVTLIFVILTAVGITLTTSAQTYGGKCGDNVTWKLDPDTGVLTISGTGTMRNFDSYTPWSPYSYDIKTVTIEDGITNIGDYAFNSCYSLTNVSIPSSVTSIGNYAFDSCYFLTNVTIPNGVTSIGEAAFSDCSALMSITIPNSVTSIGNWAFSHCDKLIEVYNLSSLQISKGIKNYGLVAYNALDVYTAADEKSKLWTDDNGYVFYEDGSICYLMGYSGSETSLTLPADCHGKTYDIYQYAFYKCRFLTSVKIPNSVKSIASSSFLDCTNLIQTENGVSYVDKWAIDCDTSVISVTLREDTFGIGDNAFGNCDALTSITLPNGITCIGNSAFYSCDGLASITIPNSVTSIGNKTFAFCSNLKNVTVSNSITCIGDSLFSNCTSLVNITIPDGVTSIGAYAFEYCRSLMSITLPDSVTSIGNHAFKCCDVLTSITIPDSVTSISNYTFHFCKSLTNITLPNGVTSIGDRAFSDCSSLASITISNSVKSIGKEAFWFCKRLTNITIPNGVTSIGDLAFHDCNNLENVVYIGTESEWKAIEKGKNVFSGTKFTLVIEFQPHEHTYEGVITTQSTHTTEGVKTYTCPCGETKTESVAKLPEHTYGDWEKHDGEQHKKSCECADVVYEAHTWNDGEVTTAPTTESEGVKTFTCTVCGESKTEAVEKLPVATTEATAATKEPENPSTTAPVGGSVSVTTAPDSPATTIGGTSANNSGNTSSSSGGCGSTVLGSVAIISLVSLAAVTLIKKKED